MKLVMTLLVRNEEDIIEDNILFHIDQGVDFFIVTDNLSNDRTRDILSNYEKSGILEIIDEKNDDYSQSIWVTKMARLAATEHNADWVINNDADEFWFPKNGSIKETLSKLNNNISALSVKRKNFIPIQLAHKEYGQFWNYMLYYYIDSFNANGKPLPNKVMHRANDQINIPQGNHSINNQKGLITETTEIEIFHYPMRSYDQFEQKIVLGGQAYERNVHLHKEIGSTWRKLYDLYKNESLKEWYSEQIELGHQLLVSKDFKIISKDDRLQKVMKKIYGDRKF